MISKNALIKLAKKYGMEYSDTSDGFYIQFPKKYSMVDDDYNFLDRELYKNQIQVKIMRRIDFVYENYSGKLGFLVTDKDNVNTLEEVEDTLKNILTFIEVTSTVTKQLQSKLKENKLAKDF